MKVLKWIGIVLLIVIALAVVFTFVTAICASVNQVAFYQQLRLWFGSQSAFAQLFK